MRPPVRQTPMRHGRCGVAPRPARRGRPGPARQQSGGIVAAPSPIPGHALRCGEGDGTPASASEPVRADSVHVSRLHPIARQSLAALVRRTNGVRRDSGLQTSEIYVAVRASERSAPSHGQEDIRAGSCHSATASAAARCHGPIPLGTGQPGAEPAARLRMSWGRPEHALPTEPALRRLLLMMPPRVQHVAAIAHYTPSGSRRRRDDRVTRPRWAPTHLRTRLPGARQIHRGVNELSLLRARSQSRRTCDEPWSSDPGRFCSVRGAAYAESLERVPGDTRITCQRHADRKGTGRRCSTRRGVASPPRRGVERLGAADDVQSAHRRPAQSAASETWPNGRKRKTTGAGGRFAGRAVLWWLAIE